MIVVIENLEPRMSPWLKVEYEYCIELFTGKIIFTNVLNAEMFNELSRHAPVFSESVADITRRLGLKKIIVLDPLAKDELTPNDVRGCDAVVIGGIMGDHPPRGRTRELVTSRIRNCIPRNLGREQLTIAGAAYVLKRVTEGCKVSDLEFIDGLTMSLDLGGVTLEIYLPYRFPAINGVPVLPRNYLDIIAKRSVFYEGVEVQEG